MYEETYTFNHGETNAIAVPYKKRNNESWASGFLLTTVSMPNVKLRYCIITDENDVSIVRHSRYKSEDEETCFAMGCNLPNGGLVLFHIAIKDTTTAVSVDVVEMD